MEVADVVRSLILFGVKTRMGRICVGVAVAAVLLLAVSVWAGVAKRFRESHADSPRLTTFLWSSDTTEGIAVTYRIVGSDFDSSTLPSDIRIIVKQSAELAEHWEIYETTAYFREGGKRRRVFREGPFPLKPQERNDPNTTRMWTMHWLSRDDYEVDLYLHKIKEGMTFDEVRRAIRGQEALTFRVEPLAESRTDVAALH